MAGGPLYLPVTALRIRNVSDQWFNLSKQSILFVPDQARPLFCWPPPTGWALLQSLANDRNRQLAGKLASEKSIRCAGTASSYPCRMEWMQVLSDEHDRQSESGRIRKKMRGDLHSF